MAEATLNPIGMGIGAATDIVGLFLQYYGMKEQQKQQDKALNQQMDMYNTQRQDAKYQFDTGLSEGKRQFDQNYTLNATTAANKFSLDKKAAALDEKKLNYSVADLQATREREAAERKEARTMAYLNNMTKFMNSPNGRSALLGSIKY